MNDVLIVNKDDAHRNRCLVLLLLISFTVFAAAVVLRVGIGATPYGATDHAGHPMGFNDPLRAEHYLIMLRNFSPGELLRREYLYEWVLFAAQLIGIGILLSPSRARSLLGRWFFLAQAVLFPAGLLVLPILPSLVGGFFTGRMDREGFIDIPFIPAIAHPVWVISSLIIAFALRGDGFGLSRAWGAVAQGPGLVKGPTNPG
jgi:hypothetical protein